MPSPTPSSASLAASLFPEGAAAPVPEAPAIEEPAEAPPAPAIEAPPLPHSLQALEGLQIGQPDRPRAREWSFEALCGRLCELHSPGGAPQLSAATQLVLAAQQQSQPVAWISLGASSFHPPDVAAWGVDLHALVVVRVPDARGATRAADTLLRSGAFGLVVLDLGCVGQVPVPAQTRLTGLAKKHQAVLLFLTRRDTRQRRAHTGSLGSLVSLRAEGQIERTRDPRFRCVIEITKDKLRGPGWRHEEVCHGPDGLR